MRRRRINILLRRGATLTEGIDRMKTYKTIMNGLTKVEEFVLCVITVVVTADPSQNEKFCGGFFCAQRNVFRIKIVDNLGIFSHSG